MSAAISFTPSVVLSSVSSPAPSSSSAPRGRGAPSLATLRKLATYADSPDAAPDLRAHLVAHLDTYAPLFGVSTSRLASAVTEATDETLSAHVLSSIGVALNRAREAKRDASALERDAAAARVSASLQFDPEAGGYALDASAVLECTEGGMAERAFLRFLPREGDALDVPTRSLRAILKLKADARVTLVPRRRGADAMLVIRWGSVGRMRLVGRLVEFTYKEPLTAISVPAVRRLDGGPADIVQGCEWREPPAYGREITKEQSIAILAEIRKRRECDYERSERARANRDATFRIAPLPEPPPPPPPAPVLHVPPAPPDAFERAASSRVIHPGPYPMTPPVPPPSAGPAIAKAASPVPPRPRTPGGKSGAGRGKAKAPPPPPAGAAIYTFGYAGRSPAELFQLARELGASVIDVRGIPQSRDTRWRRGALETLFGKRYEWRGATLGNKGEHRTTPAGLASLAHLAKPAILLCGCCIPAECHRHQKIARPLAAMDVRVRHLYPATLDEPGAAGWRVVDAAELQRAIDEGDTYECHDLGDILPASGA